MREVVLDTETTGLDPHQGHRIVEIGCVELINHVPTGRTYQQYLNPGRPMPQGAYAVHGLSDEFLAGKPGFSEVADAFLSFIAGSRLVIHNAAFDLGFLNAELAGVRRPPLDAGRAIDTVEMARRLFPGAPANLDALCRRFEIDLCDRTLHGALKDSHLLAAVYLELCGGRQPAFNLATSARLRSSGPRMIRHTPRVIHPTLEERTAHAAFLQGLTDPVWNLRP
ncbi:MAG: DNA polymerase III subunit epsilon [Rhodospirillales bacterium]|nr:DNA polymerase III subunit epsilon [Rhodospirillales bacterium]